MRQTQLADSQYDARIVEEGLSEVERYEQRESAPYLFEPGRREFVQTLGAGLMILAAVNPARAQQRGRGRGQAPRRDERLSERFHLGEDGIVTVLTSKVEVGQGSRTEIAQAAAEEFRLPIDRIRLVMADTELCPDDGGTAGSRTTPSTVPRVRNAAAAAFEVLAGFAAAKLGVGRGELKIENGQFTFGDRKLSLGDLAKDPELVEKLKAAPPSDVKLVPIDQWRVLGKDAAKVGGRDVVTGSHKYPSDIVRPGMLYGKVLRPVSYGATLQSIDLEPARQMADVTVVREGEFVGCVAATSWQAGKAVEAIAKSAEWDRPAHPSSKELFDVLKRTAQEGRGGRDARSDAATVPAGNPAREISAEYSIAYVQHAPMEPRAAVAEWEGDKLTVWTGSQQPARVQRDLCDAFRLQPNRVRVIVPDTGGGFGGKHSGEAAVEAARLAKAAGKPVHLRWTREEEFTWAYFRPAGLIEVSAGIDEAGSLAKWEFTNYNSGQSAIETPYRVASRRVRFVDSQAPLRQGSYRALASTANTFARESAMDELAALAQADPLEFRLKNLADGRLKDVLVAAAKKFDWPSARAKTGKGRGVGLGCGTEKGSYVAACAEVEVADGKIRVVRVCQAYECGAILNPRNLRAQVEGSIIMGLGAALTEEIQFEDGKITNPDFASYRVPRMSNVPELDVVLVNRPDLPAVGGSETPIIAVAPAVANAVFHATGIRSRSMPLRLA